LVMDTATQFEGVGECASDNAKVSEATAVIASERGTSISWATQGLEEYLAWHQRVVLSLQEKDDTGPLEKQRHRFLIYTCNPLSLCGGHGDRTNGMLTTFLLAVLTSRVFLIDSDSPLPLGLVLQPRRHDHGRPILDWRVNGGAVGATSHNFYLDDRVAFQADLDWLIHDQSSVVLVSMNHRELGAIFSHPLLRQRAIQLGLRCRAHLYARLWAVLFEPTSAVHMRLQVARDELRLHGPMPWDDTRDLSSASNNVAANDEGFLAIHFRTGNESARSWWDPARHALTSIELFLGCAYHAEREAGLPSSARWFLSADTEAAYTAAPVSELRRKGKLAVLSADSSSNGGGWQLAHVDRSTASLSMRGFMDAYAAYLLVASAKAVVLSRSYFGETAAEIGAVPFAYFAEGCVRVDLSSS